MADEKKKLMQRVRTLGFSLVEAELFLDSHPGCKESIEYYEKQLEKYREAVAEYEKKYAPITTHSGVVNGRWAWAECPWPWERSEN